MFKNANYKQELDRQTDNQADKQMDIFLAEYKSSRQCLGGPVSSAVASLTGSQAISIWILASVIGQHWTVAWLVKEILKGSQALSLLM